MTSLFGIFVLGLTVIVSACNFAGETGNIQIFVFDVPPQNINNCIDGLYNSGEILHCDSIPSIYRNDKDLTITYVIDRNDTLTFGYAIKANQSDRSWVILTHAGKFGDTLGRDEDLQSDERIFFRSQFIKHVIEPLENCTGSKADLLR